MNLVADSFLPVELVFNPNWWYNNAGIAFDESFYLDRETRIKYDVTMRRVLHERYGQFGLGEASPLPRPTIGSEHVAGGIVIPGLLGAHIRFQADAAPQPEPMALSPDEIDRLDIDGWQARWPMNRLIADIDVLERQDGHVTGDLNTDGLLNAAYHLYGQDFFADFYAAPQRVHKLLEQIGKLIVDVATEIFKHTASYSISVNRMAARLSPSPFIHANCSVPMISPKSYREFQLPVERWMAEQIQPFGIHHCGANLDKFAPEYARLPVDYVEVGWGSDVASSRTYLPNVFMNLRLSPMRMLRCTPKEIAEDTERLLRAAGPLERVGLCCINMDHGTPDDNIAAMFEVVEQYRHYGA